MSSVRVTYSGLVSFLIAIIRIFAGLAFILIVTRILTPEEYGTYNLILSLLVYVTILPSIISYWTTREVARGIKSGKTAVISGGFFSIAGIVIYLIIAFFVSEQTSIEANILFFSSILIPVMFIQTVLSAISLGWKPELNSYGLLLLELVRIPIALLLIFNLSLGVYGVILAAFFGYLANIILLIVKSKEKIINRINRKFLKNWLNRSWLSIFPSIPSLIWALDVLVFTLIVGSVDGVGYYSAALLIGMLVFHSHLISTTGAYPKLLEGGKHDYLEDNITRAFYFAIPLAAISIVFSRYGLYALNPVYEIIFPAVIFLAIRFFLFVFFNIFSHFLRGDEKVDVFEGSSFKDYLKSKLFFVPTLQLIQYSSYIIVLAIVLFLFGPTHSQTDLVIFWSVIALCSQIPFTAYLYYLTKKKFQLRLHLSSIIKYFCAGVITFGLTYKISEHYLDFHEKIFTFLPNLLVFIGFGIIAYVVFTYAIDNRTRFLIKSIFTEIKKISND